MKSAARSKTSPRTLTGELKLRQDLASLKAPETGIAENRRQAPHERAVPYESLGYDAAGQVFDVELDNMISTGLYLRLPRQLKTGGIALAINDHHFL